MHIDSKLNFTQQIENPHQPGEFMDVPPIKNAIVMNVGDLMMRWSNGRIITANRLPHFFGDMAHTKRALK